MFDGPVSGLVLWRLMDGNQVPNGVSRSFLTSPPNIPFVGQVLVPSADSLHPCAALHTGLALLCNKSQR